MGVLPFRIEAGAIGGRVELDGEDVTDRIIAADLHISDNEPSILTLHHRPGTGPIEGEAIIQVVDHDMPPVELIRGFLDAVDTAALEQRILETGDWGSSTGDACIAALKELLA